MVHVDESKENVTYFDGKASVSIGSSWFSANLHVTFPEGWSGMWRAAFRAAAAVLWHNTGSVDMVKRLAVPFMIERVTRNGRTLMISREQLDDWIARKAVAALLQNQLRIPVPPCHPGGPPVS